MARLRRPATFRARELRRSETPAESALWTLLRDRRLDGAKFRRQHPLGRYFADFYCHEARLVIEADGAPHHPRPLRDHVRDEWLRSAGILVLRFENREILLRPDAVLLRIRASLVTRRTPRDGLE